MPEPIRQELSGRVRPGVIGGLSSSRISATFNHHETDAKMQDDQIRIVEGILAKILLRLWLQQKKAAKKTSQNS